MTNKFPGNGLLMAATGCVIGLAILNELMELNRNIKMERTVIVPVEPIWLDPSSVTVEGAFKEERKVTEEVIQEAREEVKRSRRRNPRPKSESELQREDGVYTIPINVPQTDKIN